MTINTNEPQRLRNGDTVEGLLAHLESLPVDALTNEDKLTELVLGQRETRKLVKQFLDGMESNPMMKTLGKMLGGR